MISFILAGGYNTHMLTSSLLSLRTPSETAQLLAARLRQLRLLKGWTRQTLAMRAGVSPASLKRFENTGQASLEHLLKIAHALARLNELETLFQPPPAQTLSELENRATQKSRQRGRL